MRRSISFDRIAPFYRAIEGIFAAGFLQRSRLAFLDEISKPVHALFVGEGNGRCLAEFVKSHPHAHFTCLDASSAMLKLAEKRVAKLQTGSVDFVHTDLLAWRTDQKFDLIVSHYFLDCFDAEGLAKVIPHLAAVATPDARWLIADFHQPPTGMRKGFAAFLLTALYRFFGLATGLATRQLVAPDPFLHQAGFQKIRRRSFACGLIQCDLWKISPQLQRNNSPSRAVSTIHSGES